MNDLKESKAEIRRFMQNYYTDERLAMLLAHAQDGRLEYKSCCCFVGVSDAKHNLRGFFDRDWHAHDMRGEAKWKASRAYCALGSGLSDDDRRRILIPMIRAEMKRRERATASEATERGVEAVSTVPCGQADPVES